jgi:hypothetical protein
MRFSQTCHPVLYVLSSADDDLLSAGRFIMGTRELKKRFRTQKIAFGACKEHFLYYVSNDIVLYYVSNDIVLYYVSNDIVFVLCI